jgi:shikimate dehydrogenase
VAEEIGKKTGQVIATGGGMVLQQKAMDALRQNGKVIWVKRPLEELARDGRPLSKDLATLEEMARHREPLYRKYSEETLSWEKEKGEEK